MRIALLSALAEPNEADADSESERPAFRRFAGKTVLTHQIDCALQLGCSRALVRGSETAPELRSAKAYAERAGMRFDALGSHAHLAAQVTANDEVLLIADGVLPEHVVVLETLGTGPGVLAFPSEPALDRGFERIDATRAWSGVLRTRGDCVARLADLPADCDLASSLLRIALQAGGQIRDIGAAPLIEGAWLRKVDQRTTADGAWRWVMRHVQPAAFTAPGRAVAERLGLRLARDLAGGRWARAPHAAAAAGGALASLTLFLDRPIASLLALLAAQFALACAAVFERVEATGAPPRPPNRWLTAGALIGDALLVVALARMVATVPGWLSWFLPLMALGVLVQGSAGGARDLRPLFADRISLLLILLPLAYAGWTTAAVAGLMAAALAALLWAALRSKAKRLTAD